MWWMMCRAGQTIDSLRFGRIPLCVYSWSFLAIYSPEHNKEALPGWESVVGLPSPCLQSGAVDFLPPLLPPLQDTPGLLQPVGLQTVNAYPLRVRGIRCLLFPSRVAQQRTCRRNDATALHTGGF